MPKKRRSLSFFIVLIIVCLMAAAGLLQSAISLAVIRASAAGDAGASSLSALPCVLTLIQVGCGALVLGSVLVFLHFFVIKRISALVNGIDSFDRDPERLQELAAGWNDELGTVASHASGALRSLRERTAELRASNEELEHLARTDRLTGLANRRQFDYSVQQTTRRLLRERKEVNHKGIIAVVEMDIDHFKLYNDTYGHMAGDACLRAVAEAAEASIRRPDDLACRFGGEEFLFLLPNTDEEGAWHVAELIRSRVESLGLPNEQSPVAPMVTVSLGAASEVVGDDFNVAVLIEAADRALYAAKRSGRNRVVRYSSLPDSSRI